VRGSTGARTDNDLLDDVAADGTSVAEAREKKAQEGADAKAKRAQDASDNAAELARMKKDTTSRADDQLS